VISAWFSAQRLLLPLTLIVTVFAFASTACHRGVERDVKSGPEVLYDQAHKALRAQDYARAIKLYEALDARFPFSDQSRQGRLDLMYAYYRNGEAESAVDAADQFIRENPTHPRVDYAHYLKGLVYFERTPNFLERFFKVDLSARAPTDARKSFAAFQVVVTQFPKSDYAHDARRRMIYLRNRLASYEVNVARYYLHRGAYVGAVARAKYAIENYDGAPAVREALAIMADAYGKLDMPDLAKQTQAVYAQNFPEDPDRAGAREKKRRWWWPD
jgi:outer membrane protein assembly factor BamD